MYLIAIGWIYVVLMMALAEALSPQGTVLGAVFTFVLYGVLPLSILLYILATPARKRALKAAEAREAAQNTSAAAAPDGGGHAAGDTVAPERKEG
jgi:mannose/fructose/N-acetylgalactosamine-specific phosphotransferase system component IID